MATFYANPDAENEMWIENAAFEGSSFRIWHYIFFCVSAFTVFVVLICCCVRIRVPRTKQDIEADYHRKKLAEKFRKRLKFIRNQDMDTLDLERALALIQQDYIKESKTNDYSVAPDQVASTLDDNENSKQKNFKSVSRVIQILQLSKKP